jgi:poly(A) polymerase Pap1
MDHKGGGDYFGVNSYKNKNPINNGSLKHNLCIIPKHISKHTISYSLNT